MLEYRNIFFAYDVFLHACNQSSLVSTYNAQWHVMTGLFAYPRFTCGFWGGEVFILCPGYFLYCHVFPMVSALEYSLLKHVVINDDL